jgi:hypothetical protein
MSANSVPAQEGGLLLVRAKATSDSAALPACRSYRLGPRRRASQVVAALLVCIVPYRWPRPRDRLMYREGHANLVAHPAPKPGR